MVTVEYNVPKKLKENFEVVKINKLGQNTSKKQFIKTKLVDDGPRYLPDSGFGTETR